MENKEYIDNGTFGNTKKYKMLGLLTTKISELNKHERRLISSFLGDFNGNIKLFETISDKNFRTYLIKIFHNDLILRINNTMINKYDDKTISYLKNFIFAKVKEIKQK